MEYKHVITDANTGEVTEVPFTVEEISALQIAEQQNAQASDPVQKLKQFLAANQDVAAILNN